MFIIRHFHCGNGPLVLGSRDHFKFEGANPASRRPRNIPDPAPGLHISTAGCTILGDVHPVCARFMIHLLLLYIERVHGAISGCTVLWEVHPASAQNKSLISDTAGIFFLPFPLVSLCRGYPASAGEQTCKILLNWARSGNNPEVVGD